MYLRASEMSKQAWSEAVKTNNLEENMLLDPLYYSFGDKEQKCWGGASKCWGGGGCKTCWGGARMKLGGCAPPPENPPVLAAPSVSLLQGYVFLLVQCYVLPFSDTIADSWMAWQ